MSKRADRAARRLRLCKIVCAVVLAAGAAGCDRCGDWIRFLSDQQLEACRDPNPRPH